MHLQMWRALFSVRLCKAQGRCLRCYDSTRGIEGNKRNRNNDILKGLGFRVWCGVSGLGVEGFGSGLQLAQMKEEVSRHGCALRQWTDLNKHSGIRDSRGLILGFLVCSMSWIPNPQKRTRTHHQVSVGYSGDVGDPQGEFRISGLGFTAETT